MNSSTPEKILDCTEDERLMLDKILSLPPEDQELMITLMRLLAEEHPALMEIQAREDQGEITKHEACALRHAFCKEYVAAAS